MGFELGTSGIQAQSSTTELQGNLGNTAEILGANHKVSFGPPDFPIRVSYFIYHSAHWSNRLSQKKFFHHHFLALNHYLEHF